MDLWFFQMFVLEKALSNNWVTEMFSLGHEIFFMIDKLKISYFGNEVNALSDYDCPLGLFRCQSVKNLRYHSRSYVEILKVFQSIFQEN